MVDIPDRIGVVLVDTFGVPYKVTSSGGVSQADNSAFTVNTDSGAPMEGLYEASPTSITDGRVGVVGITSTRDLRVSATGNVANDDVDAGYPIKTGGRASSTTPTSVASGDRVNLWLNPGGATVLSGGVTEMSSDGQSLGVPLVQRVGNASAGPLGVLPVYFNGTNLDRARGDTANGLDVDVTRLASGVVQSGAYASGSIASGAIAAGAVAAGAYVSGSILSGALASGAVVDLTNVSAPITPATATATKTLLNGAEYRSTLPTWTTGQQGAMQVGTRGSLHVELWNSDSATVNPVGSGNATGALRVELANNGTGLVGLNAGSNAIGKLAANSGVDIGDVDVTSISAGSNLIGDVSLQPRTTNGLTTFMASGSDGSSILVATAQVIKASAGKLYGYYVYNPEAAVTFVHFYNTAAASVTVGTTNPLFTLAVPAGGAANASYEMGITFSNAGWSCAATTTAGGNTAPATGASLVAWYA